MSTLYNKKLLISSFPQEPKAETTDAKWITVDALTVYLVIVQFKRSIFYQVLYCKCHW